MQSAGLNHEQKSCPVCVRLHGLQDPFSSEFQWQDLSAGNSFLEPAVGGSRLG